MWFIILGCLLYLSVNTAQVDTATKYVSKDSVDFTDSSYRNWLKSLGGSNAPATFVMLGIYKSDTVVYIQWLDNAVIYYHRRGVSVEAAFDSVLTCIKGVVNPPFSPYASGAKASHGHLYFNEFVKMFQDSTKVFSLVDSVNKDMSFYKPTNSKQRIFIAAIFTYLRIPLVTSHSSGDLYVRLKIDKSELRKRYKIVRESL